LLEFRSRKRFPNLASFRQVDAESEIAFFKRDEIFQQSQGILSPLRRPVPPRPLWSGISYLAPFLAKWNEDPVAKRRCFLYADVALNAKPQSGQERLL
jgi:hypothetical protein